MTLEKIGILGGSLSTQLKHLMILEKKQYCQSSKRVFDELMSAFCPRIIKIGNLPYLSSILRKPKPLGTEMKVIADTETIISLHFGFQIGGNALENSAFLEYADKF